MKKTLAILLTLMMMGSIAACQRREASPPAHSAMPTKVNSTVSEPDASKPAASESGHVLIAYFSLGRNAEYPEGTDASTSASLVLDDAEMVGTTEYVARLIQNMVGGDLYSIETVAPYPTDFDRVVDQNHEEMNAGTLPELKASNFDLAQYDTVFIGYPVWATNAPQAIFSFLSQYDFSGKTIVPFCTHDGYGAGGSYEDIAKAVDGERAVLEGLAVEAPGVTEAEDTVAGWLSDIGIDAQINDSDEAEGTAITISIGGVVLDGVLYDTALAREILGYLPLTISMVGFGGREYYGGVDFYPENVEGGRTTFSNGDITYCEAHHNMAIFYAQTDDPILSVEVIPIGKVTSDLAAFEELPNHVNVTFALAEES